MRRKSRGLWRTRRRKGWSWWIGIGRLASISGSGVVLNGAGRVGICEEWVSVSLFSALRSPLDEEKGSAVLTGNTAA
jgi:hypothetical protein